MNHDLINKTVFATFDPKTKDDTIEGCIGFYCFRHLELDMHGKPSSVLVYGMSVTRRAGRVGFVYDGGDAPSGRAGLALDLHQAATARIRTDAPKLKEAVSFYIDDAGKVAASSSAAFWRDRAPLIAPQIDDAASSAIYDALTGCDSVTPRPSPPAPAL